MLSQLRLHPEAAGEETRRSLLHTEAFLATSLLIGTDTKVLIGTCHESILYLRLHDGYAWGSAHLLKHLRLKELHTMQKSSRLFALIVVFSSIAAPAVHAEQTGCNPHPQHRAMAVPSTLQTIAYTVLSYFGL